MEGMEMVCFQIIASSGGAKSAYMQAIEEAKKETLTKQKK